jgi:hypothetical protein
LIAPEASNGAPSTPSRWRVTQWVLLGVIAFAAVIQQVQVSWLARTVTNDDATLLWYSAQEWASRQVRQPGFYGQSYGSTLEGLPLDALARLGLDSWVGLPVVMGLFAIAGWSLLAIAAWRRSHRVLAAAALVAPAFLSGYYVFFVTTVPTWTAPRFLAVTGVALLVMPRLPRPVEALAFSVLGQGVVVDPSNALLGVPVVLWFLLSQRVTRDRVVTLAAAAVVPAARLPNPYRRSPGERRRRATTPGSVAGRARERERAGRSCRERAVPRPAPGTRRVPGCRRRRASGRVHVDRARRPGRRCVGGHARHVLSRHVRLRPRRVLTAPAHRRRWTTVKRCK